MGDIVTLFGEMVQKACRKDPLAARRLLRFGYQAKKLQLMAMPGRHTTKAAQMAAVQTMASMITPLAHPERAAMVSLFLPCEPLQVVGLHPYSCEGFGCFLAGTQAEQEFLHYAESEGLPETFCSYHKIFIGAAEKGLMPKPRFILNTTLACDANLLTFRRMAEHFQVPQFVVDVPYEPNEDGVRHVADQLREMVRFVEKQTGQQIPDDRLSVAVARSQRSMDQFDRYMTLRADKKILGELTGEMFSAFALHTLLGTPETEAYTSQCLKEIPGAQPASGVRLLWMHTTPFWVEPLRQVTDFNPDVRTIYACSDYLKMGAGDKQTGIILPALAIPEGQATDIELTFVAASNIGGDGTGKPDAVTVTVAILEGPGSINGDQGKESEPMTPGEHWEWTPMSVKLYGITGETRVVIRSTQQGLSGYYRWYLDNVKMTKIAAE